MLGACGLAVLGMIMGGFVQGVVQHAGWPLAGAIQHNDKDNDGAGGHVAAQVAVDTHGHGPGAEDVSLLAWMYLMIARAVIVGTLMLFVLRRMMWTAWWRRCCSRRK